MPHLCTKGKKARLKMLELHDTECMQYMPKIPTLDSNMTIGNVVTKASMAGITSRTSAAQLQAYIGYHTAQWQ